MNKPLLYFSLFYNEEIYYKPTANGIIEEKTIDEAKTPLALILVENNLSDINKNLIEKILNSVDLDLNEVTLQEGILKFDINNHPESGKIILFGNFNNELTQANGQLFIDQNNQQQIVHSPDLETLANNRQLKIALWNSLKKLFNKA